MDKLTDLFVASRLERQNLFLFIWRVATEQARHIIELNAWLDKQEQEQLNLFGE